MLSPYKHTNASSTWAAGLSACTLSTDLVDCPPGSVRVGAVQGFKGLEADVVILVGLDARPPSAPGAVRASRARAALAICLALEAAGLSLGPHLTGGAIPMLTLNRIHHAAIIASDVAVSRRFYTECLGLEGGGGAFPGRAQFLEAGTWPCPDGRRLSCSRGFPGAPPKAPAVLAGPRGACATWRLGGRRGGPCKQAAGSTACAAKTPIGARAWMSSRAAASWRVLCRPRRLPLLSCTGGGFSPKSIRVANRQSR